MTWDRSTERTAQDASKVAAGTSSPVFFADPPGPWQRGTNELFRQHGRRGTNLSRGTKEEIQAVAISLNGRPPQGPWLEDPG